MTSQPRDTRYVIRKTLSLLAIIALGALLRFYRIGADGLWIDEAFSVWMGRQPVGEMLSWLVRIDQHPPLYYLLLHLWMRLGDDEATVRALSALCSTLTIPVIYLLGRRLAGRRLGLLAALILAVSPFHVHLAQEARMYALLALNASLALYALARLLTDPRSATELPGRQVTTAWRAWRAARLLTDPHAATLALGRQTVDFLRTWRAACRRPPLRTIETDLAWLAYVVFTTATLLTHNTAVFLPIAANIFVLGLFFVHRHPRSSAPPLLCPPRNWLLAQAGIFLLWLPWLPAFIYQSLGVYREFWLPSLTLETVVGTVGVFVSEFLLLPLWGLWLVGIFCAALVAMGVVYFGHRPARAMLLLVVFAAPILGAWLVSLRRPIFYDRTLIWASLPLYVLLAAGICNFEPQRREGRKDKTVKPLRLYGERLFAGGWRLPCAIAVTLAILALNGLSLHAYYVHFEKEQWDEAAAFVAERVEPDDLILFNATWMQIPFDYYFHQLNTAPVAEHGAPVDLFDRSVLEPKMAESDLPRLRSLVGDRQRVWLVYSHTWYTDPDGLIPPTLEEALDLQGRWKFHGLQVWLYGKSR